MKVNKKPYIAFGLSFFEDVNCLPHCLDSVLGNKRLRPYVKVLALDGKYKGYPISHSLSQDGSRELIKEYMDRYPGQVELYDVANLHERFKRQRYVDIAAQQEIPFLFILDSDETIECRRVGKFLDELRMIEDVWVDRTKVIQENIDNDDVPIIPHAAHVYHIKNAALDDLGYVIEAGPRPRLWYNYKNMVYSTHSFFSVTHDDKGKLFDSSQQFTPLFVLQNMQIWHDHGCRTQDRERRRHFYELERLPGLETK